MKILILVIFLVFAHCGDNIVDNVDTKKYVTFIFRFENVINKFFESYPVREVRWQDTKNLMVYRTFDVSNTKSYSTLVTNPSGVATLICEFNVYTKDTAYYEFLVRDTIKSDCNTVWTIKGHTAQYRQNGLDWLGIADVSGNTIIYIPYN